MILPTIRKSARPGFTLTEMLVVVAIIVVLAGVAVPITLNVLSDARKDTATAQMKNLRGAVRAYTSRNQQPPATMEELLAPPLGNGTLTREAIIDPWGRLYQLSIVGGDDPDTMIFEIWSEGPNPGNPASRIVVSSQ